jgi:hypothetical protein
MFIRSLIIVFSIHQSGTITNHFPLFYCENTASAAFVAKSFDKIVEAEAYSLPVAL